MEGELLHFDPASIMTFSEAEQTVQLEMMRHLQITDANTEKVVSMEDVWSKSRAGTLFVWLRHFGWCDTERVIGTLHILLIVCRAVCQYKVTLLAQRMDDFIALGYDVCLVGLGSTKTALKYTSHLKACARAAV